ncbi:MAG TPA: hypothetical protein VMA75_01720 [Candidatus Paceibacterota bacterium]|nr:hypothetical protein [Candidatus Paceibacterota bacterium]
MEKTKAIRRLSLIFGTATMLAVVFGAHAARAATLSFSPQAGTYFSGRSFSVSVIVSSPDQAMNAVQAEVSFPPDELQVLSVSEAGSIIDLWVQNPTFSNEDGTINFGGVAVNPGYQGSGGKIVTIQFEAKNPGTAALSFLSGSVLANDGKGTNILASMGRASFIVAPLSTAPASTNPGTAGSTGPGVVIINSDPALASGQWYNINKITFSWSAPTNAEGVDYAISPNPNLQLPDVGQGLVSQASYDLSNFADGPWYFYVSFNNGSAWSPPSVKEFLLDRTPPDPFIISREGADQPDSRPVFQWVASDAASGIDHYEVKIGDGDWFDASTIQAGSSTYVLPLQSPASARTLTVRAFDKAGNHTDATVDFSVPGVPCNGGAFFCRLPVFFSQWGWVIVGILVILLILAYGFIYHLLRWKKISAKELKKFEDELRHDLGVIHEEAEKARSGAVDLRPSHLAREKRELEKEVEHISEDVKKEIRDLGGK